MLKKALQFKLRLLMVIVFILLVLQLTSAYILGFVIKNQEDLQFSKLTNSPLIKVIHHEYHRGLFSSDDSAEITINNLYVSNITKLLFKNSSESQLLNNTYTIKYNTHIEHGFLAGVFNGYFVPTLAYSKTDLVYPDNIKKTLDDFFKDKTPLQIENIMYLNKSGYYKISSPTFLYSEAVSGVKITWGGLNFIMQYDKDFNRFASNLVVPSFELSAPTKGKIILHDVKLTVNSHHSENMISVGRTSVAVDLFKVEWKDKIALNFSPGDMLHMFTGINATEFLNKMDVINPNQFTFNNVTYSSKSSDEDGFFDADAKAGFGSLNTNDKNYGPMVFDLSLKHVQSKSFSEMIDKIKTLSNDEKSSSDEIKTQMLQAIKTYFVPILVNRPVIQLNQFNLNTPDGEIKIQGLATTNNFKAEDISDSLKFKQKLVVDMNMSAPKSVLSYIFILQMKYLLTSGNTSMDDQSAKALTKVVNILLDNQVNGWTHQGYITDNKGILSTHLVMKDGILTLNGKISK